MDEEINVWLYDILNAIIKIESFFEDKPKDFIKHTADIKTKRAVERNIEIIGEAMSRILKMDITVPISNSRKLVDVRNSIIHG